MAASETPKCSAFRITLWALAPSQALFRKPSEFTRVDKGNHTRISRRQPERLFWKERWTMPVKEWPPALYHLSLVYPGRVPL